MTFTRFASRCSAPIVWLLWRLGLVDRALWNACIGAWNTHLFDARWHYVHFDDPIAALPEEVVLAGIQYATHSHEGIVVFVQEDFGSRIRLERDPHDPFAFLWYVQVVGRAVPAAHVVQAYEWVCGVYGGSHQRRVAA